MKRNKLTIAGAVVLVLILLAGAWWYWAARFFTDPSVLWPQRYIQAEEKLPELDSPYTIGVKRGDGTYTMYLFSAPVQYKTPQGYRIIQNRIVPAEDGGFTVEGNPIAMQLPKTLRDPFTITKNKEDHIEFRLEGADEYHSGRQTEYRNQYGDKVNAVVYESDASTLAFYPVNTGLKCEITYNENMEQSTIKFRMQFQGGILREESERAFLFSKSNPVDAVFYPFYGMDKDTVVNPLPQAELVGRDEFTLTTSVQAKKGRRMECSFEFYQNKIPDCTVYSKQDSHYLSATALVGDQFQTGTGYHFMRFRFHYLMDMLADHLLSAKLYIKSLGGSGKPPVLYQAYGQWTSTQMEWQQKYVFETRLAEGKPQGGMLQFDITGFAKDCLEDDSMFTESQGGVLKTEPAGFQLLATNDHALYIPYVAMNVKQLPDALRVLENINPEEE